LGHAFCNHDTSHVTMKKPTNTVISASDGSSLRPLDGSRNTRAQMRWDLEVLRLTRTRGSSERRHAGHSPACFEMEIEIETPTFLLHDFTKRRVNARPEQLNDELGRVPDRWLLQVLLPSEIPKLTSGVVASMRASRTIPGCGRLTKYNIDRYATGSISSIL
jgi:hypothetical protein